MATPLNEAKVGEPCRDSGHVTGRSKSGRSRFSSCLRRSPSRYPLDARRPPGRALSFFHTLLTLPPPPPPPPLLFPCLTCPMTCHQGSHQRSSHAGDPTLALAIAHRPPSSSHFPSPHASCAPGWVARTSAAAGAGSIAERRGMTTHAHGMPPSALACARRLAWRSRARA